MTPVNLLPAILLHKLQPQAKCQMWYIAISFIIYMEKMTHLYWSSTSISASAIIYEEILKIHNCFVHIVIFIAIVCFNPTGISGIGCLFRLFLKKNDFYRWHLDSKYSLERKVILTKQNDTIRFYLISFFPSQINKFIYSKKTSGTCWIVPKYFRNKFNCSKKNAILTKIIKSN